MKIHLRIFLQNKGAWKLKGLIHFPIMQWIWLKFVTLSVESLSQFKISPFFLSVIWILKSQTSLSSSLSLVTFFQWRDRELGSTWAAREVPVGHEDSGPPQWSQLAPWSGQPSPSYGVTRQVRAIKSLLSANDADFWEHRCMINDPRQPRYCFHRVKNTSPGHAIISAADARASTPLSARRLVPPRTRHGT